MRRLTLKQSRLLGLVQHLLRYVGVSHQAHAAFVDHFICTAKVWELQRLHGAHFAFALGGHHFGKECHLRVEVDHVAKPQDAKTIEQRFHDFPRGNIDYADATTPVPILG